MIRNAVGTLIRSTTVTATTNRTIGRLAVRTSTMIGPAKSARRIVAIGARISRTRTSGRTTLPSGVRLRRLRATAVMPNAADVARGAARGDSLVDPSSGQWGRGA